MIARIRIVSQGNIAVFEDEHEALERIMVVVVVEKMIFSLIIMGRPHCDIDCDTKLASSSCCSICSKFEIFSVLFRFLLCVFSELIFSGTPTVDGICFLIEWSYHVGTPWKPSFDGSHFLVGLHFCLMLCHPQEVC